MSEDACPMFHLRGYDDFPRRQRYFPLVAKVTATGMHNARNRFADAMRTALEAARADFFDETGVPVAGFETQLIDHTYIGGPSPNYMLGQFKVETPEHHTLPELQPEQRRRVGGWLRSAIPDLIRIERVNWLSRSITLHYGCCNALLHSARALDAVNPQVLRSSLVGLLSVAMNDRDGNIGPTFWWGNPQPSGNNRLKKNYTSRVIALELTALMIEAGDLDTEILADPVLMHHL